MSVPSPTTDDVDRGAELCRNFQADFLIALGGGSVIDCAKAIAAVAPGRTPAADYLYRRAFPCEGTLPVVAIPTTSGTGSELNRSAIITDSKVPFKDGIRSDRLFPRLAIVDATLTGSLDHVQTAQTGFDCFSHAVESYVSPKARPGHGPAGARGNPPGLSVSSRGPDQSWRLGRPRATRPGQHDDGDQPDVRGNVLSPSRGQVPLCFASRDFSRPKCGIVLLPVDIVQLSGKRVAVC